MVSRLVCHCEFPKGTKQSIYFNTKPLFIIFLLLLFSFTPFNNLHSQSSQPNPDSIPFDQAVNYTAGINPHHVFCADLDGDLDNDLAVANYGSNDVSILKNNGDGIFQFSASYSAGSYPFSVFCADLDGDSDLDLAVSNAWSQSISIFKNEGDGTFQSAVNYGTDIYPRSVFCADLDGYLDLDLATANLYTDNVSILKNNGDGTFQTKVDYEAGGGPWFVFCADFDRDLDLDLAIANGGSNLVGNSYINQDLVNGSSDNVSILINLTPHPLSAFLLSTPTDKDSLKNLIHFNWQHSIDPGQRDTVRYDLYLSRSIVFHPDSTIVYDSLLDTTFTDSLDLKLWYWKVKAYDKWGATRWSNETWSFYVYLCGDDNGDGKITVSDVVYEINYLFKGGPVLKPLMAGDVNCDSKVTVADVVYTINYLFKGGPNPCKDCP